MIRRLIILLLIVGCVFGDTIIYKQSMFISDTLTNIVVINFDNQSNRIPLKENVCFSREKIIDCIPCKSIISILDSSNKHIDFKCVQSIKDELQHTFKKVAFPTGLFFLFIIFVSSIFY